MKNWNSGFLIILSILLSGIFSTVTFAQGEVYRYTATSFTGTFVDLSSSGVNIGNGDDNEYIFSGPPFDFNYDSVTYSAGTDMYVQTNGYTGWSGLPNDGDLEYDDGVGEFTIHPNAINPFSCDLVVGGDVYGDGPAGSLYYETTGTAPNRVFTIEWYNFETYENGNFTSMEVKLYETSNVIEALYADHNFYLAQPFDGDGGGTGLNGQVANAPNDYLRFGSNAQLSTPSSDVRFTPPVLLPPQELSLTPIPKILNFGTVAAGVSDTLYATVNSVGAPGTSITITGTNLSAASAYSIISGPPVGTIIPQGNSVQYGIQFLPLNSGTLTGIFTVATNGRDSGTQSINLTGVGAVPDVSYSATSMFRGVNVELTDTSGIQYLYVNSTGAGPLNIKSVSFFGLDARAYFITHMPQSQIPSGGVDSIGVRFVPDLEGLPDAHLVINTTAANIPSDTVSLFGVGILPHLTIDSGKSYPLPTIMNFDSVNIGTQSCMQVTLTNPGSDTIAIERNYFESADYDFSISPITGRDTLIPPGGSQQIQVCFTPLQQGHREAEIRIVTNIPHTETTPPLDTSTFIVNIEGVGVPTVGKLLVTSPAQTDSAIAEPGYSSGCQIDTLWNTTDATIIVDSITISGSNFNYKVDESALTLPPHTHSTFEVCADPTDTGAITALLTAYGMSGETLLTGTLNLEVYGELIASQTGIGTPLSSLTCDSENATIIATNLGGVPDIFTMSIGGSDAADFTITSPSTSPTLLAGQSFTFIIRFTPSKVGAESVTVSLIRTADGMTLGPNSLLGTGGAATIGGQGTAATAAPSAPAEQFFDTVTNTGSCPWTPGIPTLADNVDFTYVGGATTPIPAGGTGLLTFMFNPSATAGQYSSNVAFSNSVGLATSVSNTVYGTVAESDVQPVAESNGFSLEQNYPNPFSGKSQCEITLPVACVVHLSVIDVEGQVVQTLLNQHYDAGSFEVTLDATGLASGTYYYQMTAGDITLTKQMVILK
jgi:Abnormal spindle-like microcephaly-assoc'd, ASPM-SPD-2-Hydin/Secretion system C-terminal sorting domain